MQTHTLKGTPMGKRTQIHRRAERDRQASAGQPCPALPGSGKRPDGQGAPLIAIGGEGGSEEDKVSLRHVDTDVS